MYNHTVVWNRQGVNRMSSYCICPETNANFVVSSDLSRQLSGTQSYWSLSFLPKYKEDKTDDNVLWAQYRESDGGLMRWRGRYSYAGCQEDQALWSSRCIKPSSFRNVLALAALI